MDRSFALPQMNLERTVYCLHNAWDESQQSEQRMAKNERDDSIEVDRVATTATYNATDISQVTSNNDDTTMFCAKSTFSTLIQPPCSLRLPPHSKGRLHIRHRKSSQPFLWRFGRHVLDIIVEEQVRHQELDLLDGEESTGTRVLAVTCGNERLAAVRSHESTIQEQRQRWDETIGKGTRLTKLHKVGSGCHSAQVLAL